MNPVIPHFTSECLKRIGVERPEKEILWPKIKKEILVNDYINFIIQINGKTRSILNLKTGFNKEEILDLVKNHEKIKNYLNGKSIKNIIFIPNKLINLII